MTGSDSKYKFVFLLVSINTISSLSNLTQEVSKSNLPSSEKHLQLQRILSEDTRWVTFELAGYFNEKQSYRLVSHTADLFDVNSSTGRVTLKNGRVLDYEDPSQRSIQLIIHARALQTGALTRIVLTILVTDVNDESPAFKNKPYPYLATVGPNTPANQKVYKLYAVDPDANSNITYNINSGAESRFIIRTETSTLAGGQVIKVGNIYTQGQGRFEENREYPLTCSATDNAVNPVQKTFATVYVKVGFRPPQFYETTFRGTVRENNGIDQTLNNELKIEAKAFQGNALSYELRDADNSTSARFSIDADGTIKTQQVLDYESVPREQRPPVYELNVFAKEAVTNLQSSAKLFIEVLDDNDNKPVFDLSRYSATHPEDLAVGRSVITVQAQDKDDGVNGELVYSVDHENFAVNTSSTTTQDGRIQYIGTIYVKQPLDYDRLPGHFYSFTVTATDKGSPSSTGTANVGVFMTNVNDEPPEIILDNHKLSVREDANVGEVVTVVQAVDLDRDRVEFYFSPERTTYEIFDIVPTSGLIRVSRPVPTDRDEYVLNITAIDDGSCCGSTNQLSSEVYLNVEIVDINTHKPSFPDCSQYSSTTFKENEPPSTPILQVQAVDQNRGENGRVTYSILRRPTQPRILFNIDTDTGNLTSAQPFDRETQSSYSITVKGNDQGIPPLDGYCTFTVSIDDVNDNAPVFDQPRYNAKISQDFQPGHSIITVRADDADLGINADVIYSLVPSNDAAFFHIENEAGIIYLNKSVGQQSQFSFDVKATDKGQPPLETSVEVVVIITEITSKPPSWIRNDYDSTPFRIPETVPISYVISTFEARSNVDDPTVTYSLIDSNGQIAESVPPFGINYAGNVVNLTVFSSMDFNVKNRYEIRLRGSNRGAVVMFSEIHPVIELIDTNNKVPKFFGLDTQTSYYPGSLPENSPPGQTVIEIKAFDEDPTSPNNLLTFSIIDKPGVSDKFEIRKIDDNTAVLLSKVEFDREDTSQLYLDVIVKDGTESSRPNHPPGQPNTAKVVVSIRVTDMNDNSPYFTQTYTASVREDASIRESIVAVSAKDPDDAAVLSYLIPGGNVQKSFGVQAKTGVVFVARQLDYETEQHVYTLTMNVSDGIYSNSTTVTIHVLDANDNSPVFAEDPYVVTNVVEEDTSITASNPMFLVQVSATDADINRPTNIRYSLLGSGTQPPENYFDINEETGQLYLLTSLDRDLPSGRATYQFNVRAQDELDPPPGSTSLDPPKFGYTSVQVKPIDINDNAPLFISSAEGSVMEHSPRGSSVMTVVAIDYDEGMNGTVVYEIVEGPSEISNGFKFSIQPNTGLMQTNTNEAGLDRETTPTYTVKVKASDRGNEPMAAETEVTISLDDKNDQIPKFEKLIYQIEMSEALTTGPIGRVKATDDDVGENARLDYSLRNHLDFFSINTDENNNEGSINVFKSVDYENPNQRFFNLTVVVQDPEPTHTSVAYVEVTVTDFNDNAPQFVKSRIEVSEYESAPVGTLLAHFSASDADSGMNAIFEYSIDQKTDHGHLFMVDQNSNVTIRQKMDRETQAEHTVYILAIDKGVPAQTGTATLVIKVLDVNDKYPIFSNDYHPIVMENAKIYPALVQVIEAVDKDKVLFGAPFGFAEPNCSNGTNVCPCDARPSCHDFSFVFNPTGDLGRGSGIISTKRIFDREHQKLYYLPLLTWDMRGTGDPRSQTGTNTLIIEIGDVNDNKHSPGHKDILVYIYKGIPGSVDIGTVYAEDPDDWDVVDKTFTLTGPGTLDKYFSVDRDSGMISLKTNIPIQQESYKLDADVYDRVWNLSVPCTISVKVESLQDEASHSLGSMRIAGTTAEEFVAKPMTGSGAQSQFDKFRSFIANHQNVFLDPESVRVVSVQDNNGMVDVYFSVQSWWGFYSSSNANAVVLVNKDLLEKELGVKIVQVPVNTCPDELQHTSSCYNQLVVTHKPLLVNSNNTAVVGVNVSTKARYECRTGIYPPADKCSIDYCYNGGTCKLDLWGDAVCQCLNGYEGPRCQGTHHSFDGLSYALYDPLEQCESSRTSLYFITEHEDGLILYNGPTTDRPAGSEDPTDFISLELVSGYPRLRIDHGSGEVELYIDGRNSHGFVKVQKLSDGKWHRIDILRNGREVEIVVDHCDQAEIGPDALLQDDTMCRKSATTPNNSKFLNINTLLQLGGRFSQPNHPQGIMPTNFNGCIKNVMHNGKVYDLTVSGNHSYPSGDNRCPREDAICGYNFDSQRYQPRYTCGAQGNCDSNLIQRTAKCVCRPGFKSDFNGQNCSTAATVKDLGTDSFIQFRLKDSFFNNVKSSSLKMQMMFRTRDTDGVLWTVDSNSDMFITLQIVNGRITVLYNMGGQNRTLQLYNSVASNGAWHSTTVERHGREFTLSMDDGEGPNYNFTYGYPDDELEFMIDNIVTVGATVSFSNSVSSLSSKLEHTCIQDIRMDDEWFPLDSHEASQSSASDIMTASRVSNGCYRDDCHHAICPHGQVCVPMWGTYTCSCADHFELSGSVCVPKDYCKNSKCLQGSTCVTDLTTDEKYACHCPADTSGQFCEHILPNKGNLQFDKANQSVIMPESQTSGIIASVWVTGNHSNIKYSIQNGRGHFGVTGMPYSALVRVIKPVDYEVPDQRSFQLVIVAEENRTGIMVTATTTVYVTVQDVNDNFPAFAQNYHLIVMENYLTFPELVGTVLGKDADSVLFGAPFGFRCANTSACDDFTLKFDPAGDSGRGSVDVSTTRMYDREHQKLYYLPLLTWDMRGTRDPRSQTGTNTLTIEIGDVNDNKHSPGHKDIFVYTYQGLKYPLLLGNVYAEDLDDWDVVDKTFQFAGPQFMAKFFAINYNSGEITLIAPVPGRTSVSFSVDVTDNFWRSTVRSLVTVHFRSLNLQDIKSAVPFRLADITPEEFIWREKASGNISDYHLSKYDLFHQAVSKTVSSSVDHVDVFSLHAYGADTDVWVSIKGQGYNGTLLLNTTSFHDQLKVASQIGLTTVPLDSFRTPKTTGHSLLVNTNATSIVGVQLASLP